MSYRPQFFFEKDKDFDFIGEACNSIPLFWALIYQNSRYSISFENRMSNPTLIIEPQNLVMPYISFEGEVQLCWQDFTIMLQKKIAKGYNIVLDLADILLFDEEEDNLSTLIDVNNACLKLFANQIDYFMNQIARNLTHSDLLGFCELSEVEPEKYPTLYSKIANKTHFNPKGSLSGAIWLILKESTIILLGIVLFLSSLFCIIIYSQWIIGLLGILFFGLGTIFYILISYEKIKEYIINLKKSH